MHCEDKEKDLITEKGHCLLFVSSERLFIQLRLSCRDITNHSFKSIMTTAGFF